VYRRRVEINPIEVIPTVINKAKDISLNLVCLQGYALPKERIVQNS
jgi:hypothetical protein